MIPLIATGCFALLTALCAGLLGYALGWPSIADPTPPAASQDLSDEDRGQLGAVHHGCFDAYTDDSAACAECAPVLDAWWARREAAA